ncbi:YitT family protein [Estrella lausannensis]|uniref:Conserved putative membrane protein n=1 Tax=Estrella lausannensis TaxID=483423 RepID=A0A0H5DTR7_9BACT|nr:YitT family protein [Estrella lausannensis]CRX39274.1 Conserved putative membrane protein [Estrella lausannensis]
MALAHASAKRSIIHELFLLVWMVIGAFLAAFAIEVFLIPNQLIDGGIVGIAMILSGLTAQSYLPYFLVALNLPFLVTAYRSIGKIFLFHFIFAVFSFALSFTLIHNYLTWHFDGESLEVVVIGGAILGIGLGLIIRYGGCLDGTEIMGILLSKKVGVSVGQVVLACNIVIFGAFGLISKDWHPPLLSLITYMVVIKVMDAVIVGLDETKSVMVVSSKSQEVREAIINELGLGVTVMYGRGGFSGAEKEILYVIAERLQLSELKDLIHRNDPAAFIAIENLHEVAYGMENNTARRKAKPSVIKKIGKALIGRKAK